MAKKSLLLLVHQGRSYVEMIRKYLDELGYACLVLSSQALQVKDYELTKSHCERIWYVAEDYLNESHIPQVLQDAKAEGYEISAVLATFEGYRQLMASTNFSLGIPDAAPEAVRIGMDKHLCRNSLQQQGLSHVRSTLLNADTFASLRQSEEKLFIKPRRGAGSFACFRLDQDFSLEKLHELQQQMQQDVAFKAIFAGQFDFIAEGYISGDEYSFEVLVADGESFVIGVHAKYLDESMGTTLETSNSCPAPRLSNAEQRAGEVYIDRCLAALGLREGCYHIETRYDASIQRWDIIEINVRMGGSLINQSIGVFTGGFSMLDLWVRLLCSHTPAERTAMLNLLSSLRESTRRSNGGVSHGTVFLSRYGEKNRVIDEISIEGLKRQPDIYNIPVKKGDHLPDSERGIFILNALWKVEIAHIADELKELPAMLDDGMVVRYADRH